MCIKKKESVDVAIEKLFKCAYFIAKEDLAFRKLESLLRLLRECGVEGLPRMYNDNKACASFILHISKALEAEIYDRLRKSPWFGLMVDEATDVSVTKNLILYATFVEGRQVRTSYLGLLEVEDGTSNTITESILALLKKWNIDVRKMMGFRSDGASVMVGMSTGVATRLKSYNPFMTSLHCCAHRTNLCVQEASKNIEVKETCKQLDALVNRVAAHFSRSSLRQGELTKMQDALEYTHLHILGIVKTRWLSRHGAIMRVCDVYEPLMKTLQSQSDAYNIFLSLRNFKVVYMLHFLADVLKIMSTLSMEFQKEYVDVTCIGGLAMIAIGEIEEQFLHHVMMDLNGFEKDSYNYPIIPEYGREKGMLSVLRDAIKGNMYKSILMDRCIDGEDLIEAIQFQTLFSKALIETIKKRLQDPVTLCALNMLSPMNMSIGSTSILAQKTMGLNELKTLGNFYGIQKMVDGKAFSPIIDNDKLYDEYAIFKRQATTEWLGRDFLDVWGMINCNDVWKEKLPELLKIALIGLIQCSSTAACERGFSRLNLIKNKFRNRLKNNAVDALMRISIEGPELEEHDFNASILLWRESKAYRHIFTGTSQEHDDEIEDFIEDID